MNPTPLPTGQTITAAVAKPSWLERWHIHASMNSDYNAIDGLRGIAILLVVACHVCTFKSDSSTWIRLIGGTISAGRCGVTVFFCLSGFLISLPFWKRKLRGERRLTPPGYASRRFWKIYPPLALSILICTPIALVSSGNSDVIPTAFRWLLGTPLFFPVSSVLNPVMWTLIVEVHFYATLPLLFLLTRRIGFNGTLAILFTMLWVVPNVWKWWFFAPGFDPSSPQMINTRFPILLDGFAFGVLIAGLESTGKLRRSNARLAPLGLALLMASMVASSALAFSHVEFGWLLEAVHLTCIFASGMALLSIADPECLTARLVSIPILRWCGIISYEWYLLHQPLHNLYIWYFGAPEGDIGRWLMKVVVVSTSSIAIAATFYFFYSKPILQWGRKRERLRRGA